MVNGKISIDRAQRGLNGPNGSLHVSLDERLSSFGLNHTQVRVEPEFLKEGTELDGVAKKVFLDRYALKDERGNSVEKYPEQMWRRVARAISSVEVGDKKAEWEEKFYKAMEDFKFVPGGRILSGAGAGYEVTYYNCYVLPSPHDSRWGIMENLSEMIDIMARGGGVGINLSSLRPRGSRVKRINGFSSGPINWAELYSVATHDVIQQGGTRRGALMLMLWDWHPDIEEFITVKRDLSRIIGANLSVCVSDKFMEAVKNDGDWDLVFPDLNDPEYDRIWDGILDNWLKLGKKVEVRRTLKARYLWNLICEAAWASAEPGLHFMERSNKFNNSWYFNYLNCTNPCGEEPLSNYGVCNLGSVNLANFVTETGGMDYDSLREYAKVAVRFLDNVIDGDIYVFEGIRETQLNGERRVGLGTMGLGDALIKMRLRYGSDESLPVIERIYKTIRDAAFEVSSDIASEKGPFPKFNIEKYLQGRFIQGLPDYIKEKIAKQGIRNSVLLMQAPTGSTSLMCGVTSGIEPVYEFSFIRRDRLGEHKIYHLLYKQWRDEHPGEPVADWFVSANDLVPEEHVRVQAAVQKYVDASISKTVNAPKTHTIEDVKKLYTLAYESGLKGITYMRDGSRPGVLTREAPSASSGQAPSDKKEEQGGIDRPMVHFDSGQVLADRPEMMAGATYRMVTPVGSAFITINNDDKGNPLEIFINIGKAGSDLTAMAAGMGRLLSTLLRLNSPISPKRRAEKVMEQLSGIGGRRSVGFGASRIYSLPDAVAQALSRHLALFSLNSGDLVVEVPDPAGRANTLQAGAVMAAHNPDPTLAPADSENSVEVYKGNGVSASADVCPACGVAALVYEEGCSKCYACGHAEC